MSALQSFHPGIRNWFEESFTSPTPVQEQSWTRIAAGENLLITAPTGSGKTLTAFLWALNQFAMQNWLPGQTSVLYISPLKALNNDIQRNLNVPLAALRADIDFPNISVQTRSGDTAQNDRQRMLRRPPEILITTPESLVLLLTTTKGRHALRTVETVIVDEIHSIVDNRRGAQLMTSLERLRRLCGNFQRLALSATVNPLDAIAGYVAGFDEHGAPRPIAIVAPASSKQIAFRVRFPEDAKAALENGKKIWEPLSRSFRSLIEKNQSTLFFTNSRRLAEKITLKINEDQPEPVAYAHHGSLAREIRNEVESRLKAGELKAIVATSSLEMGIDVGHLDEVVMVQSPPSVAATLQRIGRAGHQVGEISRGTLYPTHANDFLEAAALAQSIAERDIEPLTPLTNALDVLAQIIVSMCATETWQIDDLFALVRQSTPYHGLAREQFDLLIEMLAGRYAGSRVRELKPRLAFDRIAQTVKAQKGAVFALYNSGGTIPDRGYFQLRHADSGAVIGELDEEFVWEASVGQTFTLGTQNWQVQRITHNDVLVRAAGPGAAVPPFWRSETYNRSFHFSQRILEYLELAEGELRAKRSTRLTDKLTQEQGFDAPAAAELVAYLKRQREATHAPLPHRHHVLIELVQSGPGGYRGPNDTRQVVIHTLWGGRLNRPWALALQAAWSRKFAEQAEIHADDNAVVIQVQGDVDPTALITLVTPANLDTMLRETLESSGFFGARFRECAGRALLLTRQRFNQRLPLWMSRLQAKKLMTATRAYSDFPILLETWRTCLQDEFDLRNLSGMLGELQEGAIDWTHVSTRSPSPFAGYVTFDQVNRYMYADDTPENDAASGRSALAEDLIRSAVSNPQLRPQVKAEIVVEFEAKRQRLAPGYEPGEPDDWQEWAKERILIPAHEISEVPAHENLVWLTHANSGRRWLSHRELLHALRTSALGAGLDLPSDSPEIEDSRSDRELALEMLSFYGPRSAAQIEALLPNIPDGLLETDETLICGSLIAGDAGEYYCDADNYEILLRFQRASLRPEIAPRPAQRLPGFLASWQGFGREPSDNNLLETLEQLRAYTAPATTWIGELLQARLPDFHPGLLEAALTLHDFAWQGAAKQRITLGYPEDLELVCDAPKSNPEISALFADPNARYEFMQLAEQRPGTLEQFNQQWWDSVWDGLLAADSLAPVQQGLERKFAIQTAADRPRSSRRRIPRSLGWAGNWYLNPAASARSGLESASAPDPLEALEEAKDRARLILERYGFLCRELCNREGGRLRWRALFSALRLMELSGEVLAGYYFAGLSGPQFMSPAAFTLLQNDARAPEHFWLNAMDPIAPCGLALEWEELPRRMPHNYLAFFQGTLALVVENQGRRLRFQIPPEHPQLAKVCAPLSHLLLARKRISVAEINGQPSRESAYLEPLGQIYQAVKDHKQIYLENR
jgi:ATP-dependent Lhr-like helicase